MLEIYSQVVKEIDADPFDFTPSSEPLFDNFSPEIKDMLLPFGKNKAGCLICYWLSSKNTDDCPIVWIDSEGEPNAVFASNLLAFFSILPYGTGSIYDMIMAAESQTIKSVNEQPQSQQAVNSHSPGPQPPENTMFEMKLNELLSIQTEKDPFGLVLKNYKQFHQITERIGKNRL